jgi:hypothetical protein
VPIKAKKQPIRASFQAIGARGWRLETGGWWLGAWDLRKGAELDFLPRAAVLTRTGGRAGRASFPCKRESTSQTVADALPAERIRTFRGNDARLEGDVILNDGAPRAANGVDALFICELRSSGGAICGRLLRNLGRMGRPASDNV